MKRLAPWVIAAIAFVAFAASFSELQRIRKRFGEVTRHTFHDHQDVRWRVIRAHLAEADNPIIIIGDSITEMAQFPESISGKRVINGGIGGATILDYAALASKILDGSNPSIIVVSIGANDRGSKTIQEDLSTLLSVLKPRAPVLLVDLPTGPTTDNIHPTAEASRLWVRGVVAQIMRMM
jgi:lysophospholipase L1-like esterase